MIELTISETEFLENLLTEIVQDANRSAQYGCVVTPLLETLGFPGSFDFNAQEIGFLQYLMQEQSEIWGRQSSTANEKQPVVLGSFVPQKTRQLIKSISDKLGARLSVDTATPSFPVSPRAEGSPSIMTDPALNK